MTKYSSRLGPAPASEMADTQTLYLAGVRFRRVCFLSSLLMFSNTVVSGKKNDGYILKQIWNLKHTMILSLINFLIRRVEQKLTKDVIT